jgi:hypothetical protein
VVQPGKGALDDPAVAAEAGAVLGLAAGDLGLDPALPNVASVFVVVVAAVGGEAVGSFPRPADAASDGRDGVEQRDQLRDVVAVAASECAGERDPGRVDQEVVL